MTEGDTRRAPVAAAPACTAAQITRLLQFGDSMFPVGGFAFSGGSNPRCRSGW